MNIRAKTDGDGETGVGSDYGVVPDGGFVPVGDVADYGGCGGDEGVVGLEGDVVEEGHFGAMACEYLEVLIRSHDLMRGRLVGIEFSCISTSGSVHQSIKLSKHQRHKRCAYL